MSTAATSEADEAVQPLPAVRRVLVLRSCRAPQFAAAVASARHRHRNATIVALTAGDPDPVLAAGVDEVIALRTKRFSIFRSFVSLWRLRREQYQEVVVPQMGPWPDAHLNVYAFVLALRWGRLRLHPGDEDDVTFDNHSQLFAYTLRAMGGLPPWLDAAVFLSLIAASCVAKRRIDPADDGRRPRVLLLISSLGVGGAQVQLGQLINRMPAEYDIDLVVLGRSDGEFSRQWIERSDVTISYVTSWPRLTVSVLELRTRCVEQRYDLVHTWLFMANVVGAAAARLAGVPVVIASVRNLSVWKRERWYRKWWHRPADILASRAADVVTVNATALVADHARWALMPHARIEVVHNGLDPARLAISRDAARLHLLALTGAPSNAVLVGTVGRLAPEKDQRTFLRMLAVVRADRPDVHAIVIGNGELRSSLEAEARAHGLDGHVSFLGERPDARALMAGFDLFSLTSLSEGFPNVLLEATFLGVPCVATDIAGTPDVLAAAASLFPAGDAAVGAARILNALASPATTAARARAARQRALNLFTADRSVATWLALYDRLLDPHRVRRDREPLAA